MKNCNGICLTGYDIGLPSSEVAYPHPDCPEHGDPSTACFVCEGYGGLQGCYDKPVGVAGATLCPMCGGSGVFRG